LRSAFGYPPREVTSRAKVHTSVTPRLSDGKINAVGELDCARRKYRKAVLALFPPAGGSQDRLV